MIAGYDSDFLEHVTGEHVIILDSSVLQYNVALSTVTRKHNYIYLSLYKVTIPPIVLVAYTRQVEQNLDH